jgi:hypothetical protein
LSTFGWRARRRRSASGRVAAGGCYRRRRSVRHRRRCARRRRHLADHGGRGRSHDDLLGSNQRLLQGHIGVLRKQRLQILLGAALGAIELFDGFRLLLLAARPESRAAPRGRRERHVTEAALRTRDVTMVGAVLDLPAGAQPILLKCVVALDDVLELEALRGVADLCLAQGIDATVDVLTGHGRLDLLDTDEVLLV